jgi:molybdate transport system permease protein
MFEGLQQADLGPLWLSFKLAAATLALLLLLGTPLAWWLARSRRWYKSAIESLVALPLVLPPTVLGFYLLILFSPRHPFGAQWEALTGHTLSFSFSGLVIASAVYSLPFVVQPIQQAFEASGRWAQETATTLGAGPVRRFVMITLPMARGGFLSASVMGFAHTLGEFGVVLMIGGNIADETRVVSIAIYDHVETLAYDQAHALSLILLSLSFLSLLGLFMVNRRWTLR